MTPEMQAALDEYLKATEGYASQSYDQLTPAEMQETALAGVQYDPRMLEYEMSALRALEEQGREGLTAQDKAAIAAAERQAGQAARGRRGAIEQGMRSRGISGSGLDLVAQLQSAESANELAAMKALEQGALSSQRRTQGQLQAGQMAGQIGQRQYQTAAEKAAAQDAIRQFNAQNRMQAQQFNIQNAQQLAANKLGAQQAAAQMKYAAQADAYNRNLMEKERKRRQRQGMAGAVLGAIGGGIGAYAGKTPEAAQAGYQIGSSLGGAFAEGGVVPGTPNVPGDSYLNDTTLIAASPGEVVIPRSLASDPVASAAYVAGINSVPSYLKKNYASGGPIGDLKLFDVRDIEKPEGPQLPPNYVPPVQAAQTDSFPGIKDPQQRAALEAIKARVEANKAATPEIKSPEQRAQEAKSIFDIFKSDQKPEIEQPTQKFDIAEYIDSAKDEMQKAKERQKYLALADVVGQSIAQFAAAKAQPIALAGRLEDLGKTPQFLERPTYQYKPTLEAGGKDVEQARKNVEMALKYRDQELDRQTRELQYKAQLENKDIQNQMLLMGALGKEAYAQGLRSKQDLKPYEKAFLDALDKQTELESKQALATGKYISEADKAEAERKFKADQAKLDREADIKIKQAELDLKKAIATGDRALKEKISQDLINLKKQSAAARAKEAAKPKPKQLTEYDKKTIKFLASMQKAERDFANVMKKHAGFDPANLKDPWFSQLGPLGSKFFVSDAYKAAKQAEKEFVAAKFRDVTGAGSSEGEYEKEASIYFPRPGDSPTVLAQKAEARKTAIKAMQDQIGTQATTSAAPSGGSDKVVVRYKGKLKEIDRNRLQEAIKLGAEEVK